MLSRLDGDWFEEGMFWPAVDVEAEAASRLREVLAENALRDEEATDYRAAFQKAEVELAEERRQHNMSCADAHEALDKAEAELAAVRAERDALAKDAARYRWLRDVGDGTWVPLSHRQGWWSGIAVDAAIDAALKAAP